MESPRHRRVPGARLLHWRPVHLDLLRRAPRRIAAGRIGAAERVSSGEPDLFYQNNIKGWGPGLCERRPDVTMAMVDCLPEPDVTAPTPISSSP